jgi:hypothetical protein
MTNTKEKPLEGDERQLNRASKTPQTTHSNPSGMKPGRTDSSADSAKETETITKGATAKTPKVTDRNESDEVIREHGEASDKSGQKVPCLTCKKSFKKSVESVKCEVCGLHSCRKCLKLAETKFEVLLREDAFWVCSKGCRLIAKEALAARSAKDAIQHGMALEGQDKLEMSMREQINREINTQLDEKFRCIAGIAEAVTGIESQLAEMKREQANQLRNSLPGRLKDDEWPAIGSQGFWALNEESDKEETSGGHWGEVVRRKKAGVKKIMEEAIRETGKEVMKDALKDTDKEAKLKDDKARNNIIFGVEEPSGDRKEREEKDKVYINNLCTEMEADEAELEEIRRLGIKKVGKSRPLRIRWKSVEDKDDFMSKLGNLKNCEAKYRKIDIRHDLTPDQQKQLKEAKKEAKERTTDSISEGFLYRVTIQRAPNWETKVTRVKASEEQVARIVERITAERQRRLHMEAPPSQGGEQSEQTNL